MIILEICQKQRFDIIAMTPRGTLGLCCVRIAQLMTHPAVYTLPFTLQLCYRSLGILQTVTKSHKVHISSHDILQKLHNIDFVWNRSQGFYREEIEKQKFPAFPVNFFENNQKLFSWSLIEKNCHTRYSLLNVLLISFLILYFSFRFHSTWLCKKIMKNFIL